MDKELEESLKKIISCHIDSLLMTFISSSLLSSSNKAQYEELTQDQSKELLQSIQKVKVKLESLFLDLHQQLSLSTSTGKENGEDLRKSASQLIGKHLSSILTNANTPEQILLAVFELLQFIFEYFYFVLTSPLPPLQVQHVKPLDAPIKQQSPSSDDDDLLVIDSESASKPLPQSPPKKNPELPLEFIILTYVNELGGELGRFRFLNDLIRLSSPKYLGERTPPSVKTKSLQFIHASILLFESSALKLDSIQPLLNSKGVSMSNFRKNLDPSKFQAVLQSIDGLGTAYSHPPPLKLSPRSDQLPFPEYYFQKYFEHSSKGLGASNPSYSSNKESSIFDTPQNSLKLKRLLSSTNPEDIEEANHLIQSLISHEGKVNEHKYAIKSLLENIRANSQLLWEILLNYNESQGENSQVRSLLDKLSSKLGSPKIGPDGEGQRKGGTGKLIDFGGEELLECGSQSGPSDVKELGFTDDILGSIKESRGRLATTFSELLAEDERGQRCFGQSQPAEDMNKLQGDIIELGDTLDELVELKSLLLQPPKEVPQKEVTLLTPSPSKEPPPKKGSESEYMKDLAGIGENDPNDLVHGTQSINLLD